MAVLAIWQLAYYLLLKNRKVEVVENYGISFLQFYKSWPDKI